MKYTLCTWYFIYVATHKHVRPQIKVNGVWCAWLNFLSLNCYGQWVILLLFVYFTEESTDSNILYRNILRG